jgi:hypothetical protein
MGTGVISRNVASPPWTRGICGAFLVLVSLLSGRVLAAADPSFQMTLRGQDLIEGQTTLSTKAQKTLAPVVAALLAHPRVHISVQGLDEGRSPDGETARRRAEIGRAHLLEQGLPQDQVTMVDTATSPAATHAPDGKPRILRLTLSGPQQDLDAVRRSVAGPDAPSMADRRAHLDLGAGWPELSLRLDLAAPVELEAKVVVADGLDVAGARVYWDYARWQRVDLNTGLEAGYVDLHGASNWNGSGWEAGAFAGAEVSLASWLSLEADLGPTHLSLQLSGDRVDQWTWVANTALYLRLF